ncbi:TrkH family potassium uptake protein [Haloferacaceae archaeon DSL9]
MTRLRVDYRASLGLVGTVLKFLSVPLLLPVVVALAYGESVVPFAVTIAVTLGLGVSLERLGSDRDLGPREGLLMVATTWLLVALVGSLPYFIEAYGIPPIYDAPHPESTLRHPADALFESMSGFTTTGATVLGEISLDAHDRSIMIWRQLTQWLGGMGIIVLAIAILPELSVGGAQLMDAEAPGPKLEKLAPRIAQTARLLWIAYIGLTVVEIGLLYALHLLGLAPNMGLYNAVAHGLSTMPTGGFSPEARSIEAFSAAVQWIVIPFMVLAGTNFALIWAAVNGRPRMLVRDTEFRWYLGAMGVLASVVAALLFTGTGFTNAAAPGLTYDQVYLDEITAAIGGSVEPAVRHALFQIVSLTTTTGYASIDFDAWSSSAKAMLLLAMFLGGSGGSTGGGIKIVRWYVIVKSLRRELFTTAHPEAIRPVRLAGKPLDERTIRGIYAFTLLYFVLFAVSVGVLMLDATRAGQELELIEGITAVAATLGNIGPGFGVVGPMGGYIEFSSFAKIYMVFLMWIGRLEIFPVLVLLTSAFWKR